MTATANPMTLPAPAGSAAPAGPAPAPPDRRRRRWHRLAIPFVALGLFWGATFLAHHLNQPNAADPGSLSPTGTGPDGSIQLAQLLVDRGIVIQRVTTTAEAVQAARQTSATVFVPFPDFAQPDLPNQLINSGVRVVIVKPGLRGLTNLPVYPSSRWAAAVRAPGCSQFDSAGPAQVGGDSYQADFKLSVSCYGGSVVGFGTDSSEYFVVGATEPFRNSYLNEVGNAAFATTLLGTRPTVIWLDEHTREPVARNPIAFPKLNLPQYRRGNQDRTSGAPSPYAAFPAALWALAALALGVAVLLAFARGRRLGGPVPEPLPVLIPAAEAVTGRGRLYARISARAATLNTLRAAAIRRLQAVVNPFAPRSAVPDPATLVAQLAARTGAPSAAIGETLYGPAPSSDEGLAQAVAALDALVADALRDTRSPARPATRPPASTDPPTAPPSVPPQPQGGTP